MLSIPKTHYTECSVYRILIRPKSRYAEDSLHRNYFFQNGFGIVTIRCNGIRCSEYLKQNLIYTDILIHWYTLIYNDINWDKLRSQIRIIWWVWTISELLLWTRKWTREERHWAFKYDIPSRPIELLHYVSPKSLPLKESWQSSYYMRWR